MRQENAIGLIGSACLRMMGLLVIIAEASPAYRGILHRRYIQAQRRWLDETQRMLELEQMVDDAFSEWGDKRERR